jgi:hypothetical protein
MTMTILRGGDLKRMLGAAVLGLASAGAAQAAVITFEGNAGTAFNRDTFQEAGYTVTFFDPGAAAPAGTVAIGRYIDGANPASCGAGNICPTNNPSTYLDLFNSGFVDITPATAGATFGFNSLDASFIAMLGVDYPLFPAAVQVIGFLPGGGSTFIQFNLPQTTAFQTYTTNDAALGDGDAFAQMRFTEIAILGFRCDAQGNCSSLDGGNGQIGLDNINLSEPTTGNGVPEPATASLLAAGLLGLGLRARRRS